MEDILDHNKPHQRYFEEMSRIPHGSGNEKAYSDYLALWAKDHSLSYKQDEVGNVTSPYGRRTTVLATNKTKLAT